MGQLPCLPLAQSEQGLSWALPWSGFVILSAWTNQPGCCNGALGAIFSVAAVPTAKCLSIVLLCLSRTCFCFDCRCCKPIAGHKYKKCQHSQIGFETEMSFLSNIEKLKYIILKKHPHFFCATL